ncbi:hypothetical protein COO60DRAFT_1491196, partial [Scenedesmus sp. NREL 46B-D3]
LDGPAAAAAAAAATLICSWQCSQARIVWWLLCSLVQWWLTTPVVPGDTLYVCIQDVRLAGCCVLLYSAVCLVQHSVLDQMLWQDTGASRHLLATCCSNR